MEAYRTQLQMRSTRASLVRPAILLYYLLTQPLLYARMATNGVSDSPLYPRSDLYLPSLQSRALQYYVLHYLHVCGTDMPWM